MNIEEKVKQVWHDESIKFWAEQYGKLNNCNEMMKLNLAKTELNLGMSEWYILETNKILSFCGTIPLELGWKQFADTMPNLAKELKENYDNLVEKVVEARKKQEEERQARKAKLPWYKRWFA